MKYTLIIFILLFSCKKQEFKKNEKLASFLEHFENVEKEIITNYNFLEFGKNIEIDDKYILEFLCLNKNLCFYSNSYLRNKYYYLFKYKYSKELILIFYRKLEPPLNTKVYASIININQERLVSTIMISGISQENYKAEVDISNDFKFQVKRIFYKSDFSDFSNRSNNEKEIIETYFIGKDGIFTNFKD